MPERPKGAACKVAGVGLQRFESSSRHQVKWHYSCSQPGECHFGIPIASSKVTGFELLIAQIRGRAVKCISPEWLVKFHAGYELDENDYHDVVALSDRFGIELPKEYRNHA
jgi:lincosamide nucleotidyltransferase A/C/D/E